jgi:Uma2 family endonuclease
MLIAAPGLLTSPLILVGGPGIADMTRDQFFSFCQLNPDLRIERTAEGDLVIMTPAGADSGRRNMELSMQLAVWSKRDGTGVAFDSSAGFWLPNGAERSPDASWIRRERWDALTAQQQKKFAPLAPDFVAELRSETDRLAQLRAKMQEYADNGVRLGWLVDPVERRVEVYRPGQPPAVLDNPPAVAADPELPGFTLDLAPIW